MSLRCLIENMICPDVTRVMRLTALFLCLPALAGCPFVIAPTYSVEELPLDTAPFQSYSFFNDKGEVLGKELTDDLEIVWAMWRNGETLLLPEYKGVQAMSAYLTENDGVLMNFETGSKGESANVMAKWKYGRLQILEAPVAIGSSSALYVLNANRLGDYLGLVVSDNAETLPAMVVWNDREVIYPPVPLPAPIGMDNITRAFINDRRQAALSFSLENGRDGLDVLVFDGSRVDYYFDWNTTRSSVGGLNNAGMATGGQGGRTASSIYTPWAYRDGVHILPWSDSNSQLMYGSDINEWGTIVGSEIDLQNFSAVPLLWLWQKGKQEYVGVSLQNLVDSPLPVGELLDGNNINNRGEIVQFSRTESYRFRTFLLRPNGLKLVRPFTPVDPADATINQDKLEPDQAQYPHQPQ